MAPLLSSSQPLTHVAVVNVEDVHFGSRLDFLDSGPVPAMASWAELKEQPRGVNLPGALVMGGHCTSLPRGQRAHPWVTADRAQTPSRHSGHHLMESEHSWERGRERAACEAD